MKHVEAAAAAAGKSENYEMEYDIGLLLEDNESSDEENEFV